MTYRRCGRSGLSCRPSRSGCGTTSATTGRSSTQRAILRRAFDLGVTHFDLANNYGPPYGSAEENFGRLLATDFAPYRDELVISTKAGYDMWPGPYGEWRLAQVPARQPRPEPAAHGPRLRRHLLLAPLRPGHAARGDDGRARHRRAAGQGAVRRDLVLLAGSAPREAARILRDLGTPLLIHQPSLLDAQPLDRGGPAARRARGARASAASPSRRSPRACSPTGTSTASRRLARRARRRAERGHAHRRDARARPRAERHRAASAGRRSPRWRSPGRCATRA